jgi:hypothetical protein
LLGLPLIARNRYTLSLAPVSHCQNISWIIGIRDGILDSADPSIGEMTERNLVHPLQEHEVAA